MSRSYGALLTLLYAGIIMRRHRLQDSKPLLVNTSWSSIDLERWRDMIDL